MTSAGSVVGFALVGLVLGWLVRPLSLRLRGTAPTVGWLPVVALAFLAVVVGWLAWATFRQIHRRHERLLPQHAVNRLVLGKAGALAGAVVAGGYFGYALSWLGFTEALLARQRIGHSLLAGIAATCLVVGSLFLERACRVRVDDRRNLRGGMPDATPEPTSPPAPGAGTGTRRPGRRRQRSVRVTVAVVLLCVATAAVVAALPSQSPVWLSLAAVVSLVCGWAAARIVYSELVQSRREAALDRVAQAESYRELFAARASDHAEFTSAMADRLTARERQVAALEATVASVRKRASAAEARVRRESRRLVDAQQEVHRLTERVAELEIREAEWVDGLATWNGDDAEAQRAAGDLVSDLVGWEQRSTATTVGPVAVPERKGA